MRAPAVPFTAKPFVDLDRQREKEKAVRSARGVQEGGRLSKYSVDTVWRTGV
jgi:hypothetical protein